MQGLVVPQQNFPGLGNGVVVGLMFLLHVAIAEFTVGAITLAVIMEWRALRGGREREARYARGAANAYYLLFSLGVTLAVFAVSLLLGLWSNVWGTVVSVLLPLFAFAFGLFLLIAPLLVLYRNSWGRLAPRTHAIVGTALASLQTLFVVLIVGLDSYLITPINGGLVGVNLNPPYWPLLIHRLIGNVSWAALVFAAWAAWKLRRARSDDERGFQAWAASVNLRIGLVLALVMPVAGAVLVYILSVFQPGYFNNLVAGDTAWMLVLQEAFLAVVLVGGNMALSYEARWSGGERRALDRVATPVVLAGMVVASLPSSVITPNIVALRYAGLGIAVLTTGAHLAANWRSPAQQATAVDTGARALRLARPALIAVGTFALLTALLMGVVKESARGQYALYGELTQAQAQQRFQPPADLYP
ncbi:MAG TPA: cytochrome ubiquinol oxidase subunit I [Candidatus Dormibacteraeota bacterium]